MMLTQEGGDSSHNLKVKEVEILDIKLNKQIKEIIIIPVGLLGRSDRQVRRCR